jgi:hypothetical protein
MFRSRYLFIVLGLFALIARSEEKPAPSSQFVSLQPVQHVSFAAGKPATVSLKFVIEHGFHINSNQPRSEYLIPTRLKLDPPTDIGAGSITYPAGRDISLGFSPKDKLNVYTGAFTLTARLSAAAGATAGNYTVHGELTYQACDDRSCRPPKKLPVAFDVTVLKSRVPPARSAKPRS